MKARSIFVQCDDTFYKLCKSIRKVTLEYQKNPTIEQRVMLEILAEQAMLYAYIPRNDSMLYVLN